MRKLRQDNNGFGAIEILLTLIFAAIVVFTGVYVAHISNDKATKPTATAKVTPKKAAVTPDPTASWTPYTSTTGKFSLKYPKTWATATHPELCSDGIFLLGADSNSVGKCATEGFGQMAITWRSDRAVCGDLAGDAWAQDSKETVTVSGVNGTKITATAKAPGFGVGSEPEGTKTTQYCFVHNGMAYIADYNQRSTYPDVLNDFNAMVTKTLKFN